MGRSQGVAMLDHALSAIWHELGVRTLCALVDRKKQDGIGECYAV